jgi:hypothetical protein
MRDLIRKILKEQIHPDYEWVKEENEDDVYYKISPAEIKLFLMALKISNSTFSDANYIKDTLRVLKDKFVMTDSVTLSKIILVGYFNSYGDLKHAMETKDTSDLYLGPFYVVNMDHYDDDAEEGEDSLSRECRECDGRGYEEIECRECDGSGEIEYDDEYETCTECDGSGEETSDCYHCDGHGDIDKEVKFFELSEYTVKAFSKRPIDPADYNNATDLWDDPNVLVAHRDWVTSRREEEDYEFELRSDYDTIIDFNNEDIIFNTESFIGDFI